MLFLTYHNASGQMQTVWLKPNQTLMIGSGFESDVDCRFDRQMADLHFQLQSDGNSWTVRPLRSDPLFVNGNPVAASQTLHDGCRIRAGDTEFTISIEGASTPTPTQPPEKAPPPSAPNIPLAWTQQSPIALDIQCDPTMQPLLLQSLCKGYNLYAAVNQLRLKRSIDGLPLVGDDLFEQAPEEIRATDSLHLISVPLDKLSGLSQSLLACGRSDGLSLLIAKLPLEAMIEEMRILWAWFSRPSLLRFHLLQGSKFLTDKLLEHPRCLVLSQPDDANRLQLLASTERFADLTKQIELFAQSHPTTTGSVASVAR